MGDGWVVDSLQAAPAIFVIREGLRGSHIAFILSFSRHNFLLDLDCMEGAFGDGFFGIDLDLVMFLHFVHGGTPAYTLLLLFLF